MRPLGELENAVGALDGIGETTEAIGVAKVSTFSRMAGISTYIDVCL